MRIVIIIRVFFGIIGR